MTSHCWGRSAAIFGNVPIPASSVWKGILTICLPKETQIPSRPTQRQEKMGTYIAGLKDLSWRCSSILPGWGDSLPGCVPRDCKPGAGGGQESMDPMPCCQPSSAAGNPCSYPPTGSVGKDAKYSASVPSEPLCSLVSLPSGRFKNCNGKIHSETQLCWYMQN